MQDLSREGQIELMLECLQDAHTAVVMNGSSADYMDGNGEAAIAAAFFQYRARCEDAADIPCDTPSKAADVEKD